ncbi:MAG: type II toxin-antitoxin system RelE/ParE family toxin [Candidatus Thiosymbion ectosymbiont of Robbea hypermnestra]|nr:type II toxin-antitoxin system RelE/ParE family toxin [Candidatus Thiosymbion ectosymbiont of Robbea hypermnestra]
MYTIDFAESVKEQLRYLTAHQKVTILDSIEKQLSHEPLSETRNRKQLRPNPVAPWELRIGNLRVFYEVTSDEPHIVKILAVGHKKGNKLYVGNREVEL